MPKLTTEMKLLVLPLLLCFLTTSCIFLEVNELFAGLSPASDVKFGIAVVFLYASCYLLYRIVVTFTEYRTNREYQ